MILLVAATIPAAFAAVFHPQRPALDGGAGRVPEVTRNAAEAWGDDVVWVDARRPDHYEAGHVEGAVQLSHETFDMALGDFLDVWSPGMRVVVYCDSADCGASREIAVRLQKEAGIPDVHVLSGGWQTPDVR